MLKIQSRKLLMLLYDALWQLVFCKLRVQSYTPVLNLKLKLKDRFQLFGNTFWIAGWQSLALWQFFGSLLIMMAENNYLIYQSTNTKAFNTHILCAFGINKILTRCIKGIVLLILYWFHLNIGQYFWSCIGVFSHCVYLINSKQVEQYSNNLNFFFDVLIRSKM